MFDIGRWILIGLTVGACSKSPKDASRRGDTGSAIAQGSAAAQGSAGSAAGSSSPVSSATPDDAYDAGALGALSFPVTQGTPEARAHFTHGLLALHSFWYDEALRQFKAAIVADPSMNMAYWGVAMASCKLLWNDDDLATARTALKHMPTPDALSDREGLWVEASISLVEEGGVRESRKRFLAAMEELHKNFPDDESTTFLALALIAASRPEDPDFLASRKRAADLAKSVFDHNPKHPGAAHYLIHAYDTPELAAQALPYAKAYAQIAPAAFHARHMPAHIFSRLGMWPEAIASCQSAWDASVAAAKREGLSIDHHDFHSLNWLVEMNFELGHRTAADAALKLFADEVRAGVSHRTRYLYALQASSYMARTGEWSRVDELLAPLSAPAVEEPSEPMPGTPATPVAAGSGRVAAPDHCAPAASAPTSPMELQERLAVLDTRVRAAAWQHDVPLTTKLLDEITKADPTAKSRSVGLLARARGDDKALLASLRSSTDAAEQTQNGESNPTAFLAHEQIGDALMRLGQAKAAQAEYKLALDKHPNRASSLLGLARAATKAGDAATATASYRALAQLWATADERTDALAEVRAAAAK